MKTQNVKEKQKDQEIVEQAVVTPTTENTAPFELMDAADDEQILAEVKGKGAVVAEDWIYSFMQDGKEITGLSWMGTKNAAFWFARKGFCKLDVTDVTVEPDPTNPEYMLCKARVQDQINGNSMFGFKRQWTKIMTRSRGAIDNPFWYEQGTSKAMRNAMQSMMPADWVTKLVKEWTDAGKVKKIATPTAYKVQEGTTVMATDPVKLTKQFWARFFTMKDAHDGQQILKDIETAPIEDKDKFVIKKKVQEKLTTFGGSAGGSATLTGKPNDEDIPF